MQLDGEDAHGAVIIIASNSMKTSDKPVQTTRTVHHGGDAASGTRRHVGALLRDKSSTLPWTTHE